MRDQDFLVFIVEKKKISFLIEISPVIPCLEIPKYYMGNEVLHGVVRPYKFTVFPQAIGLAATRNHLSNQQ